MRLRYRQCLSQSTNLAAETVTQLHARFSYSLQNGRIVQALILQQIMLLVR
jgi:hypothetical protein